MPVMLKRLTFTGSTLRSKSDAAKTLIAQSLRENVWPLYTNRKLRAVTTITLALEEAAKAHALMEAGEHKGKIILTL